MKEITTASVLKRHPDAAFRKIDGTAIIVMPRDAKMLTLNEVGTKVWQLLDRATVSEIAEAIAEEFDVSSEQALTDTMLFIKTLDERGLVVTRK